MRSRKQTHLSYSYDQQKPSEGSHTLLSELSGLIANWDESRSHSELVQTIARRFPNFNRQEAILVRIKRGKCMSRRKGQRGLIEEHGGYYTLRVRMDIPGEEKRQHRRIKICPIKRGPGWLNASERRRRADEILHEIGANSESRFNQVVKQSKYGVTFSEQAEHLIRTLSNRSTPASDNTIVSWKCFIRQWLNPLLGDVLLSDINNSSIKQVVQRMRLSGLTPYEEAKLRKEGHSEKAIRDAWRKPLRPSSMEQIVMVAKQVVASAIDDNGALMFPRSWNRKFIDLPKVDLEARNTPNFSREMMSRLAQYKIEVFRVLFILLAVTGARINEMLAVEIDKHIINDFRTIKIAQQQEARSFRPVQVTPTLKAQASRREIDLPCQVSEILRSFISDRKHGFLFTTMDGNPIKANSARTKHLYPALEEAGFINHFLQSSRGGFHAFRRFRNTWLRNKTPCPEGLRKYWLGHAASDMSDIYDKIKSDVAFRLEMAEICGLGFELPEAYPVFPDSNARNPNPAESKFR